MEIFIGQIIQTGYPSDFSIYNFAYCDGQLLPINENQALYALLGTQFGGDGRVTMGVPDLRGRTPVGFGQHPGSLYDWRVGQIGGFETQVLSEVQIPKHTHTHDYKNSNSLGNNLKLKVAQSGKSVDRAGSNSSLGALGNVAIDGDEKIPVSIFKDDASNFIEIDAISGEPNGSFDNNSFTIGSTGNSNPFSTLSPLLALNYQIALDGIFPSRN